MVFDSTKFCLFCHFINENFEYFHYQTEITNPNVKTANKTVSSNMNFFLKVFVLKQLNLNNNNYNYTYFHYFIKNIHHVCRVFELTQHANNFESLAFLPD